MRMESLYLISCQPKTGHGALRGISNTVKNGKINGRFEV